MKRILFFTFLTVIMLSCLNVQAEEYIINIDFCTEIFNTLNISPVEYNGAFDNIEKDSINATILQALYDCNLINRNIFGNSFISDEHIKRKNAALIFNKIYDLYVNSDKTALNITSIDDAINNVIEKNIINCDSNGSFNPDSYLTSTDMYNATDRLKEIFIEKGIKTDAMPWRQAPVLYRLDDEIKPGNVINIYGYGMKNDLQVYCEPENSAQVKPGSGASKLDIVYQENEGSYITVLLPESYESGVYKIWVENEYGISNGMYLNRARLQWISTDCSYKGQTVQLVGVNLTAERFGAKGKTRVKLINKQSGKEYEAEVTSAEPYCVKFTIPNDAEIGEYDVAITNNENLWSKLENEQEFSITEAGTDPFNLGVGWEKNYKYDKTYNVKDYGAKGDGVSDDTDSINAACKALSEAGGGILYFPKGVYRTSSITLYHYVIFAGEDRNETVIVYSGNEKANESGGEADVTFIKSVVIPKTEKEVTGYNGFSNMTFKMDDTNSEQYWPAWMMWIGMNWSYDTYRTKTAVNYEGFFMKGVTFDMPKSSLGYNNEAVNGHVAKGESILRKYYLVSDCEFNGLKAPFWPLSSNYVTFENNKFNTSFSNAEILGSYVIVENNTFELDGDTVERYGAFGAKETQGIFVRDAAYLAHNTFKNLGNTQANDGEIICMEHNGGVQKMYGDVISATENSVTVNPRRKSDGSIICTQKYAQEATGFELDGTQYGFFHIRIIGGKGVGQNRRIIANEENRYILEKNWDIVPDSTSKFVLDNTVRYVTMYDNYAENTEKGYWIYGDGHDCIIADNVGVNTGGIYISSQFRDYSNMTESKYAPEDVRIRPSYFIMIKGNEFEGASPFSGTSAISVEGVAEYSNPGWVGNLVYGVSVKDNIIRNATNNNTGNTEAPDLPGINVFTRYVNYTEPTEKLNQVIKAVTFENNKIYESPRGIVLGTIGDDGNGKKLGNEHIDGIILKGNDTENKQYEIAEKGIVNIVNIDSRVLEDLCYAVEKLSFESDAKLTDPAEATSYISELMKEICVDEDITYSVDMGNIIFSKDGYINHCDFFVSFAINGIEVKTDTLRLSFRDDSITQCYVWDFDNDALFSTSGDKVPLVDDNSLLGGNNGDISGGILEVNKVLALEQNAILNANKPWKIRIKIKSSAVNGDNILMSDEDFGYGVKLDFGKNLMTVGKFEKTTPVMITNADFSDYEDVEIYNVPDESDFRGKIYIKLSKSGEIYYAGECSQNFEITKIFEESGNDIFIDYMCIWEDYEYTSRLLVNEINPVIEVISYQGMGISKISGKIDPVQLDASRKYYTSIFDNSAITLLVTDSNDDTLLYFDQTDLDTAGNFFFDFTSKDGVVGGNVKLNVLGKTINAFTVTIKSVSDLIKVEYDILDDEKIRIDIVNKYNISFLKWMAIVAYFTEDDRLIHTEKFGNQQSFEIDKKCMSDVGDNVKKIRVFVFDGLERIIPLSERTDVKLQ